MAGAVTKESIGSQVPISCVTCIGACCSNMLFEEASQEDIQTLTGPTEPIRVSSQAEISELFHEAKKYGIKPGVYYAVNGDGTLTGMLSGRCPNLQADNRCSIYQKRPEHCQELAMGGDACRAIRRSAGVDQPERKRPLFFLRVAR